MTRALLLVITFFTIGHAHADGPVSIGGDIRGGWVGSESLDRLGRRSETGGLRGRARLGVEYNANDAWRFAVRAAAVMDSRQASAGFFLEPYAPGPDGLRAGQGTLDEIYVDYASTGGRWGVRAGRFQTAFRLAGVAPRSLDRHDSPDLGVTWTDGAWLQHHSARWTQHLILQHNHRQGPTNALRQPLWFGDGDAPVTLFAGIEAQATAGPVVQRMVGVTWVPNALRPFGPGNSARSDYLALTARGAMEWPLGTAGTSLLVGGEAGYAPHTPRRSILGSGTGDAGGVAWQGSVTLVDIVPTHSVGFVYGRVADGWLVSGDFRPNETLAELRWVWQVHPAWAVDVRVRRREEVRVPYAPLRGGRTDDAHLRTNFRF